MKKVQIEKTLVDYFERCGNNRTPSFVAIVGERAVHQVCNVYVLRKKLEKRHSGWTALWLYEDELDSFSSNKQKHKKLKKCHELANRDAASLNLFETFLYEVKTEYRRFVEAVPDTLFDLVVFQEVPRRRPLDVLGCAARRLANAGTLVVLLADKSDAQHFAVHFADLQSCEESVSFPARVFLDGLVRGMTAVGSVVLSDQLSVLAQTVSQPTPSETSLSVSVPGRVCAFAAFPSAFELLLPKLLTQRVLKKRTSTLLVAEEESAKIPVLAKRLMLSLEEAGLRRNVDFSVDPYSSSGEFLTCVRFANVFVRPTTESLEGKGFVLGFDFLNKVCVDNLAKHASSGKLVFATEGFFFGHEQTRCSPLGRFVQKNKTKLVRNDTLAPNKELVRFLVAAEQYNLVNAAKLSETVCVNKTVFVPLSQLCFAQPVVFASLLAFLQKEAFVERTCANTLWKEVRNVSAFSVLVLWKDRVVVAAAFLFDLQNAVQTNLLYKLAGEHRLRHPRFCNTAVVLLGKSDWLSNVLGCGQDCFVISQFDRKALRTASELGLLPVSVNASNSAVCFYKSGTEKLSAVATHWFHFAKESFVRNFLDGKKDSSKGFVHNLLLLGRFSAVWLQNEPALTDVEKTAVLDWKDNFRNGKKVHWVLRKLAERFLVRGSVGVLNAEKRSLLIDHILLGKSTVSSCGLTEEETVQEMEGLVSFLLQQSYT